MYGVRYVEPYDLKPKLLAWSELNVNEIDLILHMSKNQSSSSELYK